MKFLLALSLALYSINTLKLDKHRAPALSLRHNQEAQSSQETSQDYGQQNFVSFTLDDLTEEKKKASNQEEGTEEEQAGGSEGEEQEGEQNGQENQQSQQDQGTNHLEEKEDQSFGVDVYPGSIQHPVISQYVQQRKLKEDKVVKGAQQAKANFFAGLMSFNTQLPQKEQNQQNQQNQQQAQ